jgi:hypothetical protein
MRQVLKRRAKQEKQSKKDGHHAADSTMRREMMTPAGNTAALE